MRHLSLVWDFLKFRVFLIRHNNKNNKNNNNNKNNF